MNNCLIGHSGFVGTTLKKQTGFSHTYRSNDIHKIEGKAFDYIVCAGAPAQKWKANKNPLEDRKSISKLMNHLRTVICEKFILISTVDVFRKPQGVDENSNVDESELHAYGLHRRELEKFVERQFSSALIIRLPGLVGPGLRKNIIFDFLNHNNLSKIDCRDQFQFYPMVNLWSDIKIALDNKLKVVHLTSEPISVKEVASLCFNKGFDLVQNRDPARYDFRTIFSDRFKASGNYQYSRNEILLAIRAYAQSEPRIFLEQK